MTNDPFLPPHVEGLKATVERGQRERLIAELNAPLDNPSGMPNVVAQDNAGAVLAGLLIYTFIGYGITAAVAGLAILVSIAWMSIKCAFGL